MRPLGGGLPLGGVVEDVQTAAAGGNDVGDELGAFGADVAQRAAVCVQVGELLLHGAAGQAAQGPAEGNEYRCEYRCCADVCNKSNHPNSSVSMQPEKKREIKKSEYFCLFGFQIRLQILWKR